MRSFPDLGSERHMMNFATYVRKPFTVEAVQVTLDNIEEIAEMVGRLEHKADGTPYIVVEKKVNDKKFVPNIFNVYVGFWVTRMGNKTRCYSPKVFSNQFQRLVDNAKEDNTYGDSVAVIGWTTPMLEEA